MTIQGPSAVSELEARLRHRVLQGELELPVLPHTAGRLLALCQDEDCDPADLVQVADSDQALAGHLLSVANSAAYAPATPILSVQQAVMRLGLRSVLEIGVSVTMRAQVFSTRAHAAWIEEVWLHSALVSGFAKEVARLVGVEREVAALGGLLHDVGKAALLQVALRLEQAGGREYSDPELAEACAGLHAEVGARLLESWEMPEEVVETVRYHHQSEDADGFEREASLIDLANRLAKHARDAEGGGSREVPEGLDADGLSGRLGLDGGALAGLVAQGPKLLELARAVL
jgi:putative nucleotidyltransferase with HDIG domain